MIEKIKKVSNPLTIIAIFAGLAEVSGTIILPFLNDESQSVYIWFLMVFPIALIGLFFLTLNFNHRVLYAPSDFKDEDNFIRLFKKATPEERLHKLNAELESESSGSTDNKLQPSNVLERRESVSSHYLAEELVLVKLSKEFEIIEKEVVLRSRKSQFQFDAIAKKDSDVFAVEVKYIKDDSSFNRMKSSLKDIQDTLRKLPVPPSDKIGLLLAIATDQSGEDLKRLKNKIEIATATFLHPQELRVYNLSELESELINIEKL